MEKRVRHYYRLLIERLQPHLKTDVHYLFKGSSALILGQTIAGLSGFILTLGLVRIFDQAEYGLYTYIISLAGIFSAFTLSGIDISVTQAVAKGHDKTIIAGFKEKLKWTIPVALAALSVGGYYYFKGDDILGYSTLIIGLTFPLIYATTLYVSYWNGKKQFTKIASDNAYKNIAIALSILLVSYYTHNLVLGILALFLTSMVISTFRFMRLTRILDKSTQVDQKSLSFGKHLSMMDVFSNVSTYIDKIIVFQLLGATSLAIYAIALAPVRQLHGTSKIIRSLVLPKFSTRTHEELRETLPHKTYVSFGIALLLTLGYIVFAEFLFTFFFPEYREAIRYSQIMSLTLLTIPFTFYTQALTSLERKKELYILNITKPFLRLVPMIILIPIYGIWGAVVAFLLFYVIHFFLLYILFQRSLP